MRVRDAVPGDAEAIATVHVRAWQEAYGHVFPAEALGGLDVPSRVRHWRERIARGDRILVTDDVGGFASIGASNDAEAAGAGEVYAIYVTPERWGTGEGRALMAAAMEALRADGFEEAVLWVLDDNPRARRFYERAGWATDGGVKDDMFLGTRVGEVRYRVSLR
jgi:GNAT superfamily N-acetyltransferase